MSAHSIPTSWIACQLGDVVNYGQTVKVEPHDIPDTSWVLELEDIEKDTSKIIQRISFNQRKSKSTKNYFQPGDILYGKLRPYLNKILVSDSEGYCSTEIVPIQAKFTINSRYLFYWMKSPAFLDYVSAVSHGLNMPRLGTEAGQSAPLILPPLNEQNRIADKLDAVLARVDACRERLGRVPGILKRFRQAVLATATSGVLTTDWRGERVKHLSMLLPDTWEICKIRDVGSIQLGRQRSPKYHRGDNMRPYLRVQNVFEDRLDLSDIMEMDFSEADFEKYQLHYGDILLNEGQSPEYLGRPAMFRGELENVCFTNTLIRFQASDRVIPDYALLVFRNHMHSGRYVTEGNITTNIAHLGAGRFGNVEFPLPPIEEQHEIVRRVGALFVHADALEAKYHAARDQVGHLTPSLLARAFCGELVSQDPNDEPAEKLLERIRAARAVQPSVIRTRRARTPRQAAISTSAQSVAAMPAHAGLPTTQTSPAPQVSSLDPTSTLAAPAGIRTLTDLRKAAGLNQSVVAKAMGLNQACISQMETGKRAITEDQRRKLAEILGVSVEEIPR